MILEALEGQQMEDGQWRIRIETVDGVKGWVSLRSAKGSELLQLVQGSGVDSSS